MKSKTFGKKLTLNKKTIADLNIGKMKGILGGKGSPTVPQPITDTCNELSRCWYTCECS